MAKKLKWNSDKIMSLSAVVISLATLISLVYQARIMREHEMKSAFPKLELWNNWNRDSYELELINTGVGPAIIENVRVEYEDSIYNMDQANFTYFYLENIKGIKDQQFGHSNIMSGRIIQNGQRVKLIHTNRKDTISDDAVEELWRRGKAKIILKYSSVYEQHWVLEGTGEFPKRIDEKPKVIESFLGD